LHGYHDDGFFTIFCKLGSSFAINTVSLIISKLYYS
jgi:hypothetical protein